MDYCQSVTALVFQGGDTATNGFRHEALQTSLGMTDGGRAGYVENFQALSMAPRPFSPVEQLFDFFVGHPE